MLDDATRARLEQHQQDPRLFWWTREDGSRDEFHYCTACGTGAGRWPCPIATLLTAYDALLAERDALQAHLEEGMRMILALQAARAQAAPVLAAAEAWKLSGTVESVIALGDAYAIWRAAREG